MSKFMMSEELEGVLDTSVFQDEPQPILVVGTREFGTSLCKGSVVQISWAHDGKLAKAVMRLALDDLQEIVESKCVQKVGFRSSVSEKTIWISTDENLAYTIDVVEGQCFLTVTVHNPEDM